MAMRKITGKTNEEMYGRGVLAEKSSIEDRRYFPTVSIPLDALPEAKDWKPGKTYDVTLRLRMTGLYLRRNGDSKDSGDSNYEIHGVDVGSGKPMKGEKSEKISARYVEKEDDDD